MKIKQTKGCFLDICSETSSVKLVSSPKLEDISPEGQWFCIQFIGTSTSLFALFPLTRSYIRLFTGDEYSVQFNRSFTSDSLRPHESQHARPPCHHQLPEFTQIHVHQIGDAIQPSHRLSSPSPPARNSSQYQGLFQ